MTKKCGIVTITVGSNYGNRLQNYAMQTVVKQMGYIPETIQYKSSYELEPKKIELSKIEKIKRKILKLKKIGIKHIWNIAEKKLFKKKILKEKENYRTKCFEDFINNNIKMSEKKYNSKSDLEELNKEYDVFITGSDQVWNPFWEGKEEIFYLTFADKEKRIAYAPSFGVSSIPENQKSFYKKNLLEVTHISTREQQGRNIIKQLTGKEVPVVLDPTFLLKKEDWDKVAVIPKENRKYLFTYFLGILSSKRKKQIEKFAKENKLEIVSMYENWNYKSNFGGPAEFLGLIKNAEYICTDSFHGAVFSLLYNKPFTVMDREEATEQKGEKMNSRIETLLEKFELEKCKNFLNKDKDNNYNIDFKLANEKIEEERKEAFKYLKNALGI